MDARDLFLLIGGVAIAITIGALLLIPAIAHDPAQMAQWTPQQQQWLREQSSPWRAIAAMRQTAISQRRKSVTKTLVGTHTALRSWLWMSSSFPQRVIMAGSR